MNIVIEARTKVLTKDFQEFFRDTLKRKYPFSERAEVDFYPTFNKTNGQSRDVTIRVQNGRWLDGLDDFWRDVAETIHIQWPHINHVLVWEEKHLLFSSDPKHQDLVGRKNCV